MAASSWHANPTEQPEGRPLLASSERGGAVGRVRANNARNARNAHNVVAMPEERRTCQAPFTWFRAGCLAFSIITFYCDAYTDVKLPFDYLSAEKYLYGTLSALVFVAYNGLATVFSAMVRSGEQVRHLPALEHVEPTWLSKARTLSTWLLLVPPTWYAQELYYGLKSKVKDKKDDKDEKGGKQAADYLALMHDILFFNHVLRAFQTSEGLFQLIIHLCDVGRPLLDPAHLSLRQYLSILVQLVGICMGANSIYFLLRQLAPHKAESLDPGRRRPALLDAAFVCGTMFNALANFLLYAIYFIDFGFRGGATLILVRFLIAGVVWQRCANLFIVDWSGDVPRRLQRAGSACIKYLRANISTNDAIGALSPILVDVVAMSIWWYFGLEPEERRWYHTAVVLVHLALKTLSKLLMKLVVDHERKNE